MKSDIEGLNLKMQLEKLNDFIFDAGFSAKKREQYVRNPYSDFTRHRKLDFRMTVVFVLGLLKKA